jgi:hypothetical protein
MFFKLVEYSRILPQPVQLKLQVCKGSSWRTIANLGLLLILFFIIWVAILTVNSSGNLIKICFCGVLYYITILLDFKHAVTLTLNRIFVFVVSFFIRPGSRNVAGETEAPVLILLHPVLNKKTATE